MLFRLVPLAALLGVLAQCLIVAAGEQESIRSSPPDTTPYTRAGEQESVRSSPPDTTPYTRPAVPEDYASKPDAPAPPPERREPPNGGPAYPTPRAPTIPGAPPPQTK
jgi:hypothetical protein